MIHPICMHCTRTQALTQRKFEWNAEVLSCTSQLMRLRHALEFPGGDPNAAEGDDDGAHDGGCVRGFCESSRCFFGPTIIQHSPRTMCQAKHTIFCDGKQGGISESDFAFRALIALHQSC